MISKNIMPIKSFHTLFLLCIITPSIIYAKTGRCFLEVQNKTYLNGPCDIMMNDHYGSFSVGAGETHRSKHFAYVNVEDGRAYGFWNKDPDDNHAHDDLGILKKNGACWENKTARVCAYKK